MIDWEQHRYSAVRCRISLRPEYNGQPVKESAKILDGKILWLTVYWRMDKDDTYPGEFALGHPFAKHCDETMDILSSAGIGWIASGDVIPLDEPFKDVIDATGNIVLTAGQMKCLFNNGSPIC